ncbi:hypothetical protein C4573_02615 [Candidatus Woesearchaeota archaeon]|nr:MAG: hypothetical protein C4573_02615 [Candidatus Woesearchaeota archaeon]
MVTTYTLNIPQEVMPQNKAHIAQHIAAYLASQFERSNIIYANKQYEVIDSDDNLLAAIQAVQETMVTIKTQTPWQGGKKDLEKRIFEYLKQPVASLQA